MSRILGLFVYIASVIYSINCEGFYSIIAPNTLRPNTQYHVAVSIHKSPEPVSIKMGIIGTSFSNFKTVEVRPYSSELVHFEIPNLKPDRYSLTAEGITGISFTNETKLNFDAKQYSVLVQTDRAIYKPGSVVRYRVLVLDSNLKAARNYGKVDVIIKDAQKNIIRKLDDVRLTSSVYSDELQLSTFPVLGEWSINVDISGEMHSKSFEIAEYILPKFDVAIETSRHAVYKDGKITATIRSKHTFGKPIKGEATISVYPKFFGSLQPFVFDLITRKVFPIDGKAFVEFDIKNELRFKEDYQRDILLEAIIEEETTGRKQNTTTVVTMHKDRYDIETIRLPKYYISGVPFDVVVKVAQFDGTPLTDNTNPITAYLTNSYGGDEIYNRTDYRLDANGMAKLRFTVPENDRDEFHSVIVNYLGVSIDAGKVPRKRLTNDNYIYAQVINEKPMVNQEVVVSVSSNMKMSYFVYQIVGRGDILLSRSVDVPETNFHTFKFLATFAMMPIAKVLVYMVIDGEFIYDEQEIEFADDLQNFVRLEAPLQATPGQDVDITITTKPYSYVGLMAIDQNALNIRSGNDITHMHAFAELQSYNLDDVNSPISSPGRESGVVTMTNTDYFSIKAHPTTNPLVTSSAYDDDGKLTTIKKTDIGPAHKFEVNTRPPLAGPYAFSRIPKPFWNRPRIHVMHDVEDTWLFLNVSSGNEGRTTIHKRLPATMASWVLSGFSLDPVTGLGLTRTTKSLQPYKSFYITSDLPYSIKKGEVIAVPFVVFNNMGRELEAEVTLYNTGQEFDFVQLDNEVDKNPKIELYNRRNIKVPANSAQSLSFIISPKKLGVITIKATANTQLAGDSVEKTLLVEPAGATQYRNKGFFIDLRTKTVAAQNVTIQIPKNSIEESSQIEVSVVGDLLGSAIKTPDSLIRLPVGCGEQNMVNFVPNILVLKYLEKIQKLSPAIETKARKFLEVGYQRELYYHHPNGAFSSFGTSEKNSSTWLTAYVARFFRQASTYTQIDEKVIIAALEYLAKIQAENGSFPELGDEFESHDSEGVSLTSFVLLAFLENSHIPDYRNTISKALNFIVRGLDNSNDPFALAIGSYALAVGNHNAKAAFVQRLDSMAINEDGKKWWTTPTPKSESKNPWLNHTRSVNIELSSYAALTLLANNLLTDALPILKWLVDQRNAFGGFASSQDTVVGLQALIKFSEKLATTGNSLQVVFSYGQGAETKLNVNEENSIVLQTYQLPANVKNVTISATGYGIALAQVSYKYNTNVTGAWPRFILDPQVNRISHSDYLHLSICTSFVPVEGGANRSSMAVMEVGLPSGFTVDLDTLPSLEANERIKKVESKKRDTVVVIYFDYLDRKEICPTLDAYKTHKVTKHKPAPVIIYDYYDNAHKARLFYRAPKSTLCDICEGVNCGNVCERAEQRQSRRLGDKDSSLEETANAGRGGTAAAWMIPSIGPLILILILTKSML